MNHWKKGSDIMPEPHHADTTGRVPVALTDDGVTRVTMCNVWDVTPDTVWHPADMDIPTENLLSLALELDQENKDN